MEINAPLPVKDRLYQTLVEGLPNHRSDRGPCMISLNRIAVDMNISRQAVSGWFSRGKISLHSLKGLTKLPGTALTLDQLVAAMDNRFTDQ